MMKNYIDNRALSINVLLIAFMITSVLTSCGSVKKKEYFENKKINLKTNKMKKVLIIGMNPKTIDFTNPELPKGLSAEIIEKGTIATLDKLNASGYKTDLFLIDTGTTDLSQLASQLKEKNYDGVVVGNGIRGVKVNFITFEQVINVVHTSAPNSKIIFNSLPTDTEESIRRWL